MSVMLRFWVTAIVWEELVSTRKPKAIRFYCFFISAMEKQISPGYGRSEHIALKQYFRHNDVNRSFQSETFEIESN